MGQPATVINPTTRKTRKTNPAERPLRLKIDVTLVLVTFTLVVFGAIMVFSASYGISFFVAENNSPTYMFFRQAMWLAVGLLGMGLLTLWDYRVWSKLTVWGMLATILILFAVLFMSGGSEVQYARNLSGGSYQPSEMAKLMIVIYLAVWMHAKREVLSSLSFGLIPLGAILGLVGGLIFFQPDLSATLTVFLLGGIMFYLAEGGARQIFLLLLVAVVFGLIVIRFNPTGMERFDSFVPGFKDPLESSQHVKLALAAFAKGGWFGVGIGQSTLKLTVLPVPHTDSIFAVIGEEFGLVGASVVVGLFGVFLWRGLMIARRAPDALGTLLAGGVTAWIILEAFMNMLALTGLMPFAGNPLPFFSLGGSNLVFTLLGVGILLNVSRLSEQKQLEEERRKFDALINLRGRDWRRRVSRPRRTRSSKR